MGCLHKLHAGESIKFQMNSFSFVIQTLWSITYCRSCAGISIVVLFKEVIWAIISSGLVIYAWENSSIVFHNVLSNFLFARVLYSEWHPFFPGLAICNS